MIFLNRSALRAAAETMAWLARRRRRIKVAGHSMTPTLRDGQFVLVDSGRMPSVGELVVAEHPAEPGRLVVKRVGALVGDSSFELVSDNPEAGTDSRTWGPVLAENVRGTVTLILGEPLGLTGEKWAGRAPEGQ